MKNIFYFRNISEIGGIETFLYYLSKEYNDYDITIFYNNADKKQLERLKEHVNQYYDGKLFTANQLKIIEKKLQKYMEKM